MDLELYSHQLDALNRMKNGCILNGSVGSGKSRTALAYYYTKIANGSLRINGSGEFEDPKSIVPLYIITTAKKRDTNDWESEMAPFLLSTDISRSIKNIPVVVDSWNNIKKYVNVTDSFFILDEDRVTGTGAWVKAFWKIAKQNRWIILSGSPGDVWMDYMPVFVANGFYKNATDFKRCHVVYNRYVKYPLVDKYVNTKRLNWCRDQILIPMEFERKTIAHDISILVQYDNKQYKTLMKTRWDPYDNKPIENISKLCYLLRRVVNSDSSRVDAVRNILLEHDRAIIFYNYDYELEILIFIAENLCRKFAQWNGHKHEPLPTGDCWMYLVQYTAGAEGWNAITTDTMIFYSQNYSYKTMIQAAGRINRLNTPYTDLYYYHVRSAAPIDRAIKDALNRKEKFNERKFIKY